MAQDFTDTSPSALAPLPVPGLGDFEPLRRAERILLRACVAGDIAKVGFRRPEASSAAVSVRGGFLAFLARGGGPGMRVAGRRIQLLGAWIEGRVDLGDAAVPVSLWLYRCVLDHVPLLDGARVAGSLGFPDTHLPGLMAERATIAGDLLLSAGCTIPGEVRLARAAIGGDLKLDRLQLLPPEGGAGGGRRPLIADLAHVVGDVVLAGGFDALGEVRFVGARVDGDFVASAARVTGAVDSRGARGNALNLTRISVGGDLRLGSGFAAAGAVRLKRARVEGDLDCTGAAFDVVGDAGWGDGCGLELERARIGGALVLQQLKGPLLGVSLEGARTAALHDDVSTWGERLVLDGFRYERLAGGAPADAEFRADWLALQVPAHMATDFRPEPWRHLIAVLQRMGREQAAVSLAMHREAHLRHIGRVGEAAPAGLRWLVRLAHAMYGGLAGYGHRPLRVLGAMLVVWLLCSAVFWQAADRGGMAPAQAALLSDARLAACHPAPMGPRPPAASAAGGSWTNCAALPPEYPAFRPALYALELLLPLVELQQQRAWAPWTGAGWQVCVARPDQPGCWGGLAHLASWAAVLLGWLGSALLIVLAVRWGRRDRS